MSKLINGYTVEEINQYRKELIAECRQDACDCEAIGLDEMACYYDEKAETYSFMPVLDIAAYMVYKGV